MKSLKTIFQSMLAGLFAGGGVGFVFGWALYAQAKIEAENLRPEQRASHLCGPGMAPFVLALLGAVAGPVVGMIVGATIALAQREEQKFFAQNQVEK